MQVEMEPFLIDHSHAGRTMQAALFHRGQRLLREYYCYIMYISTIANDIGPLEVRQSVWLQLGDGKNIAANGLASIDVVRLTRDESGSLVGSKEEGEVADLLGGT